MRACARPLTTFQTFSSSVSWNSNRLCSLFFFLSPIPLLYPFLSFFCGMKLIVSFLCFSPCCDLHFTAWNISSVRISHFICAFVIFCPGRHRRGTSVLLCVHVCVFVRVPQPEAVVGGERLDSTGFSNPKGSTLTTTATTPRPSVPLKPPTQTDQAQGSLGLAQTTNTHFLKLQLYTTSQSNSTLLSNQQLHTRGFWVRKHPPAWLL